MKATSARRQLIVAILLALAVVGAAMRQLAPDPSLARDVGTLLLVLWLPVIGNLIAFVAARLPRRAAGGGFAPAAPFTPQLLVELTALAGATGPAADEVRCTLVVGNEGFTARLAMPLAQWLAAHQPQRVEVELLRPEVALPRLVPDAGFTLLAGHTPVGAGRVLAVRPPGAEGSAE